MLLSYVLGELLDDDLVILASAVHSWESLTFVLRAGLGLLTRLGLRLYLPFLLGERLGERGEMVRRA